jgi:ATP-dependent exoDNAse (exonuclease V) alpha subunit
LGFQTRRTKDRFELVGITREQIEKFSTRTKIIEKVAAEKGITNKAEIAKLATLTRHSKAKGLNEKEQYEHWKNRLSKDEFKTLFKLQGLPKKPKQKISAKKAIERSLEHHCERNSAFKEKDVLAYALKTSYGDLLPKDVQKALSEREDIIKAELDVVPYITTRRMLKEERNLVMAAANGKGKYVAFHPTYNPKQSFLNQQQTKAISQVLNSRDFITGIKGAAGVGKSTIISELVKAHMEKGKQLFCLAPSSQAVSVLKEKGYQADTIAGFLKKEQFHQELHGQTILVDEGGMVGTKQFNELIAIGQKQNMRYLVSGDTAQHAPPAQYGDAMRHLMEKAQINTAHVNTIVRQKNKALKSVVGSLSKGKTLDGFQKLEKMGSVKEVQDRDKRLEKIADDYVQAVIDKKTALVISPTHAENDLINENIRKKLKQKKLITGKERTFTSLRSLSFTKDQKKDLQNYEEKQIIRFLNNAKGNYRGGVTYTIIKEKKSGVLKIKHPKTGQQLPLPLEHNELFDVFKARDIQLAKGDVIRATANTKTIEGTKINNGNSYTITGFTRSGDIKLNNKKTLQKDTGHIRYQMSDTSHASQGKDADRVIVSVSDLSFSAASREQFYVSVSRGKEQATIYTSNRQELKKSIQKTEQRVSAQDIEEVHRKRFLQRQQRKSYDEFNRTKSPERKKERLSPSYSSKPVIPFNRE